MDASALYRLQSGLYVVSARAGEDVGACVINTGLQVTAEPMQVEVVVNKLNHTEGVIAAAGHFALTVITEEADMPFIGRFGFRSSVDFDKFGGITTGKTALGDPYTPECAAALLACEVVRTLDVGTHTVFVGELRDAAVLGDATPMTYAYYHNTLRGKTPPRASSYVGA